MRYVCNNSLSQLKETSIPVSCIYLALSFAEQREVEEGSGDQCGKNNTCNRLESTLSVACQVWWQHQECLDVNVKLGDSEDSINYEQS